MVQQAINAKAKVGLRSSIMIRDSDIYCPRGYHPSNAIFSAKMWTQRNTAKEYHSKEPKPKEVKPANGKTPTLLCFDKFVKLNCQEKKKEYWKKKKDQNNFTLAIGDNPTENKKKKDNKKCYNCLKKGDIAKNCLEPLKKLFWSWQTPF